MQAPIFSRKAQSRSRTGTFHTHRYLIADGVMRADPDHMTPSTAMATERREAG
jgi:hypothetical protein